MISTFLDWPLFPALTPAPARTLSFHIFEMRNRRSGGRASVGVEVGVGVGVGIRIRSD